MKRFNRAGPLGLALLLSLFLLSPSPCLAEDFYLHTTVSDFLDNIAPTATTAQAKDSAAVNRTTYEEIGVWSAAPFSSAMELLLVSNFRVWIGLKGGADTGTHFDLKAEIRKNGNVIASGETKGIRGVSANANLAKEVAVAFGALWNNQFAPADVLSLRILAKVADTGGRSRAAGLRLYFGALGRSSRFTAQFGTLAPVVTIVSPRAGSAIGDASVMVSGVLNLSPGSEVTVKVNGTVALLDRNDFATFVPVDGRTKSLTATVTNLSGATLGSHTIPITFKLSSSTANPSLRAIPDVALVLQPVGFTLSPAGAIAQIQLDGTGDGANDFTGTDLDGISVTFAEPGLYYPNVRVTDARGAVFSTSTIVRVVNVNQMDALLRGQWEGMKKALRGGDTAAAASYILSSQRAAYHAAFDNLQIPLATIDRMLGDIRYRSVNGVDIEYEMVVKDEVEGDVSSPVIFSPDEDGAWRVSYF